MRRLVQATVSGVLITAMTIAVPCRADGDSDRWFAKDKALHFGMSAGVAGATYGVSAPHFGNRYAPLLIGAGVGVLAGASKEVWDASGYGTPSWKDAAWDAMGIATGLLIAWTLDMLVRGPIRQRAK